MSTLPQPEAERGGGATPAAAPRVTPPTAPTEAPRVRRERPRWPVVLGALVVLFSVANFFVALFTAQAPHVLNDAISQAIIGGIQMHAPVLDQTPDLTPHLLALAAGSALLGLWGLIAGIRLFNRRPRSPARIRGWAVAQCAFALVLVVAAALAFNRLDDWFAIVHVGQPVAKAAEVQKAYDAVRGVLAAGAYGGLPLWYAAFPVVLGLWLRRRAVGAEAAHWPD